MSARLTTRRPSLPQTKAAHDRAKWRAIVHWPASCENDWKIGKPPVLDASHRPSKAIQLHLYSDPGNSLRADGFARQDSM